MHSMNQSVSGLSFKQLIISVLGLTACASPLNEINLEK